MNRHLFLDILMIGYSLGFKLVFYVSFALLKLLKFLGLFSPAVRRIESQLDDRPELRQLCQNLLASRQSYQRCVVFYCSSAGEYEQARPIMDRFARIEGCLIQVFFHSKSGLTYIKARPDYKIPNFSFCLAPLTDSVWDWGWIFSALRPEGTFFVRYEIWPGFLVTAYHYSKVALIGATGNLVKSPFKRILDRWIYLHIDAFYCLTDKDCDFIKKEMNFEPSPEILATGDPKYDRVYERALNSQKEPEALQKENLVAYVISQWKTLQPSLRFLIAGSIYPEDAQLLLEAYKDLPLDPPWILVLIPHHVDRENITKLTKLIRDKDLFVIQSSFFHNSPQLPSNPRRCAIIVDQMGFLAEVYALGHAAYVGGAIHAQIHNVLEPAIRGLALAWGPKYHNSREAEFLVKQGLAKVVHHPLDFVSWWGGLCEEELSRLKKALDSALHSMLGASDAIYAHWCSFTPSRLKNDFLVQSDLTPY